MARPVLNSMLLGSTDPDRLKTWYRDAFQAGVDGYGNLDLGGIGTFATLTDPDGNYVQLIQMKPEYYAGK
jgi:hypothetical protein